jgi:hypothetical protein
MDLACMIVDGSLEARILFMILYSPELWLPNKQSHILTDPTIEPSHHRQQCRGVGAAAVVTILKPFA